LSGGTSDVEKEIFGMDIKEGTLILTESKKEEYRLAKLSSERMEIQFQRKRCVKNKDPQNLVRENIAKNKNIEISSGC